MAHLLLILLKAGVGVIKDVLRLSKKRSVYIETHLCQSFYYEWWRCFKSTKSTRS